jgi:hypothetical protein
MMDDDGDPGEPFAIPDLWAPSQFFYDVQDASTFLFSELKGDGVCMQPFLGTGLADNMS